MDIDNTMMEKIEKKGRLQCFADKLYKSLKSSHISLACSLYFL